MDARELPRDFRRRVDAAKPVDVRGIVGVVLEVAALPLSYEGGVVGFDGVQAEAHVLGEPSHWYPRNTRPAAGSLVVTVSRWAMIYENDGESEIESAHASCELVLAPALASLVAPFDFHAPARATGGPDDDEARSHTSRVDLQRDLFVALGPVLDLAPAQVVMDASAPDELPEASPDHPGVERVVILGPDGRASPGALRDALDRHFADLGTGKRPRRFDTLRAIEMLVDFGTRPLERGELFIEKDVVEASFLNNVTGGKPRLKLSREIETRTPSGTFFPLVARCQLHYAPSGLEDLPAFFSIRAAGHDSPLATQPGDHEWLTATELPNVIAALRTSPIAALLERPATEYTRAATV